ncbi:alpha-amylase family protein [Umboniibacter marinipuniceus]|uniref:Glycosidase n=1 Tax=Umboniibacter marinipuniceus TaxID=569599 RepID=A0A3M0A1G0_9GAMM|nr:alpha-amylase family protein [Umboniibacter marinipuniceus]RMA78793.1 glycosidase [Umboniibacter marinipuniceus]
MSIKSSRLSLQALLAAFMIVGCGEDRTDPQQPPHTQEEQTKVVVYQVFTRLFGNTETANVPWGTIEQNGVGKFSDFTPEALEGIRELGTTHIWYTGVPHHAVIRDYRDIGVSLDDPDVVKGRAGSPYAVKDYYNVNPDLADDPSRRLEEFDALISRTHDAGMKVVIDIVPNHVARRYESISAPEGIEGFGVNDDTSVVYARDNNFYYILDEAFIVPDAINGEQPLDGEAHPLADGFFSETPAKWTGNGSRLAQPHANDWYETVKINYGVRPDGSYDFPSLPSELTGANYREHLAFWEQVDVPDSWLKFRDITQYWLARGVDGFRYDMAEMVPVEFWSYLNSHIKATNQDAFLLAEVYNPAQYRSYLQLGLMDTLYDKVGFYDTLKPLMQGQGSVSELFAIHEAVADISPSMLHFLENHDEQRIASDEFAGTPLAGKPGMLVSTTISSSPTLLYFGQDVGEDGMLDAGFGRKTRTTIFDYWGVPAHQRWMNGGAFDGGQLTEQEAALRAFYTTLMNFTVNSSAVMGEMIPLHQANLQANSGYGDQDMAFVRKLNSDWFITVASFRREASAYTLKIPENVRLMLEIDAQTKLIDKLSNEPIDVSITTQGAEISLELEAFGGLIISPQ